MRILERWGTDRDTCDSLTAGRAEPKWGEAGDENRRKEGEKRREEGEKRKYVHESQGSSAEAAGEVVLSENGHLMVCRARDRYVI